MSDKAFDTNILVYACNKANPRKQQIAQQALDTDDGVILWQTAVEFIAATRKLADQGFTPEDDWQYLGFLLSAMPLVVPTAKTLARARGLHIEQGYSF